MLCISLLIFSTELSLNHFKILVLKSGYFEWLNINESFSPGKPTPGTAVQVSSAIADRDGAAAESNPWVPLLIRAEPFEEAFDKTLAWSAVVLDQQVKMKSVLLVVLLSAAAVAVKFDCRGRMYPIDDNGNKHADATRAYDSESFWINIAEGFSTDLIVTPPLTGEPWYLCQVWFASTAGPHFNLQTCFQTWMIPIIKIKRPKARLIFILESYIGETAPLFWDEPLCAWRIIEGISNY